MGCLFSCFKINYEKIKTDEYIDNDIESVRENSDPEDYYDEMNRPRFFNDFVYHRSGYYTTD